MVLSLFLFTVAVAVAQSPPKPSERRDVPSTIIAIERAALDRSDKGDTEGFLEISAPEVTYFDPFLEQPIHGLEALRAYYRKFPASEPISGEMSNAKVQVSGDVAVLTFNYASRRSRSTVRWNATEVYRRGADGWRIIHTHWSFLKPQLAKPD
jgi:ketosteroid isomerase-like protein